MNFIGIDPGSTTYGFAIVDELGRLVKYFEVPTNLILKDVDIIIHKLLSYKPMLMALPSGLGLPFKKLDELTDEDLFYMTLEDPKKEGPLKKFILHSKGLVNGVTIPSVVELKSVPEYRKINIIDMGTADKVASAFFYRVYFNLKDFVLVEIGSYFSAIVVVSNGKIIDGFGGSLLPGFNSIGCLDAEVAVLLCNKYPNFMNKHLLISGGNPRRSLEIIRIIAEWYSYNYHLPIIISGKNKDTANFGTKYQFPFKEAAVGAAYIANSLSGGIYRDYIEMLDSEGNSLTYLKILDIMMNNVGNM